MLEDDEGSGDFILIRIKLSKWALHVSFLSPLPLPPSPLSALPVHEPSYGHHLHSTCKGSRKVQLFFLLSNNPDFPPNSWLQMIKIILLGNKRILPVEDFI